MVDVEGRLTIGEGASALRDKLRELAASDHPKVLLNLGEVSYMDSSGLGMLVASFATFTSVGGQLKLLNPTKRVKDLLVVTKLLTVFEVYDDEKVALDTFAKPAGANPVHA